jgi:hypothetical protein|tara:strand:+ start:209 stop:490 length:282 start_codon:yes stop_codon:yes gene_type:complete
MSVDLSGNDGALIGNQNFKAMRMETQGRLFIAYAVVNASRMVCFPVLGRWLVRDHLKPMPVALVCSSALSRIDTECSLLTTPLLAEQGRWYNW